jgi:hypothetical protein
MKSHLEERFMQSATQTAPISKKGLWTGRTLSGLAVLFLLFDAVIKFMNVRPVTEAFIKLGYPTSLAVPIGIVLLVCVVIYTIPRTSVLGAILLTGYLGGAIATHVRVGDSIVQPCPLSNLRRTVDLGRALLARGATALTHSPANLACAVGQAQPVVLDR